MENVIAVYHRLRDPKRPLVRLDEAAKQFSESGTITESRVRVFPEYTEALFPLTLEMQFEIVPCVGFVAPNLLSQIFRKHQ